MGSKTEEIVPQVSTGNGSLTTDSDRVKAPVVGAGPTDSGGGQSHAKTTGDDKKSGGYGWKENTDPSVRRSSLARTPPARRKGSIGVNTGVVLNEAATETVTKGGSSPTTKIKEPEVFEELPPWMTGWQAMMALLEEQQRILLTLDKAIQTMSNALPKNAPMAIKDSMAKALEYMGGLKYNGGALRKSQEIFKKELSKVNQPTMRTRLMSSESQQRTPQKKRGASETPEGGAFKRGKRRSVAHVTDSALPAGEATADEDWTLVTSKRKKTPHNAKVQAKGPNRRNTAVLIKPTESITYSDVLKALRTTVKQEENATEVKCIRKTADGHVLVELSQGTQGRSTFRERIQEVIGKDLSVRDLVPKTTVEVRDLDSLTTMDEVKDAVIRAVGQTGELRIRISKPNHREIRTATVELDEGAANALLHKGRLLVGCVYCQVKLHTTVARCYKCQGYGHTSKNCNGPDRSALCWRCGKPGHKAANCKDQPECCLCKELGTTADGLRHSTGSYKCKVSRLAHELLPQIVSELQANVVIISEPFRRRENSFWFQNDTNTAALWVPNSNGLKVEQHGKGEDQVWATINDVTYVSVYLSPNVDAQELRQKLQNLEDELRALPNKVIMAGDFNARATEWGMPHTNTRGRLILEMAARLNLLVVNTGSTTTYRRPRWGESIPDITFASEMVAGRVHE
ncbi:uncharacterized protein LOC130902923 [Diorhabda carinulata]|uniref:uncharacterized protein LOC130902923 n=1 Tax=Diorhabda carinulata TaxID=1163345 RepID=UPI0025A2EE94|nr:uncharacterized protein LOC130902923 [Diorhabda carinulata]